MQIKYKYVLIGERSGKRYARWESGDNRSFDLKCCRVVQEVEPRFEDFQPLESDSDGEPYHEELTPAQKKIAICMGWCVHQDCNVDLSFAQAFSF